jgi:site-specific recombinase XerD
MRLTKVSHLCGAVAPLDVLCAGLVYARNTIQNYVRAVEVFLRGLSKHDESLETLDEATVREFACRRLRSRKRPTIGTSSAFASAISPNMAAG